jgi:hypothetical protein
MTPYLLIALSCNEDTGRCYQVPVMEMIRNTNGL